MFASGVVGRVQPALLVGCQTYSGALSIKKRAGCIFDVLDASLTGHAG